MIILILRNQAYIIFRFQLCVSWFGKPFILGPGSLESKLSVACRTKERDDALYKVLLISYSCFWNLDDAPKSKFGSKFYTGFQVLFFPWVPLRPQTPTSLVGYPCRGYFSWGRSPVQNPVAQFIPTATISYCISILPIVFQPQNLVFVKEMQESCLLRGILVEKIWSSWPFVLWSYEWYASFLHISQF